MVIRQPIINVPRRDLLAECEEMSARHPPSGRLALVSWSVRDRTGCHPAFGLFAHTATARLGSGDQLVGLIPSPYDATRSISYERRSCTTERFNQQCHVHALNIGMDSTRRQDMRAPVHTRLLPVLSRARRTRRIARKYFQNTALGAAFAAAMSPVHPSCFPGPFFWEANPS